MQCLTVLYTHVCFQFCTQSVMAVFKFAVGLLALLLVSAWAEEVEVRIVVPYGRL